MSRFQVSYSITMDAYEFIRMFEESDKVVKEISAEVDKTTEKCRKLLDDIRAQLRYPLTLRLMYYVLDKKGAWRSRVEKICSDVEEILLQLTREYEDVTQSSTWNEIGVALQGSSVKGRMTLNNHELFKLRNFHKGRREHHIETIKRHKYNLEVAEKRLATLVTTDPVKLTIYVASRG